MGKLKKYTYKRILVMSTVNLHNFFSVKKFICVNDLEMFYLWEIYYYYFFFPVENGEGRKVVNL